MAIIPSNMCSFFCLTVLCMIVVASGQEIMTPIVTITDVNPDSKSDRITTLTSTLSRVDAILGENIIFECSVLYMKTGRPILWKYMTNTSSITLNDGLKSLDASKYRISQGTSQLSIRLEIMSVAYSSEGTYMCEVFYDDRSTEIRRSRRVHVYELPRFEIQDTSFETSASVGDSVRLRCKAVGMPTPRLYWLRSAGSSSVIRDYGRQVEGSEILFNSVQASDRGTYICNAINRIGSSQWPVRLSVNFKPAVSFENGARASQKFGCTLELLVRLFHMRGADSTIYLSIFIYPFESSHVGTYTCSAMNTVKDGTGSATIQVTASDTPVPGRTGAAICSGSSRNIATPASVAAPAALLIIVQILLAKFH
uniref:Ig-like domain-containing protein n=1 Tax=Macrostomum lignano TaxID=282301 RepID=A0A1I8HX47_9PLAT